jgi:two-component system CheB/CheR fusion protein
LKTSVSGALQHVAKENKPVRYTGISVKTSAGVEHIRLKIDPIFDPRTEFAHTLITFEPIEKQTEESKLQLDEDVNVSDLARDHISTLENELRYTKENLQATVEELETSNEELQATNEELVASNEEMQSTNEELQSVNEELYN